MDEEYQRMAANSIAHEAFCAGQAWQQAAAAQERPCVLWKPSLFRDGNQWCALLGENIQEGVVGFGDSPDAAMWAFDEAWREKLPPALPGAQPAPSFADAYQGAMEEVAIWKRRALEAEDLNRKFVAEINGPAYMGEPAQPAQKAVAYLDIGAGGYTDIGTDLNDEQLASLPKGRHMLGIVGTYGVDGYVSAQPAPSVRPAALYPVISWLRNGCDPMRAANELEMLAAAPEAKP